MKNGFKMVGAALLVAASIAAAAAQSGLRQVPMGFCSLSSMSGATKLSSCAMATMTGTGSGSNLTASSVAGLIQPGEVLSGTGVPSGTTIISQTSGSPGGAGVYVTSGPTTASAASLTASGVPRDATYAVVCAYTQGVTWRDDGVAPTGTPGTGGNGLSSGQCVPYNGTLTALQFIQQTAGAILGVGLYR